MFYKSTCSLCPSLYRSRTQIVWGHHCTRYADFTPGPQTRIMFIGEAPGWGEDRSGVPFDPDAMTGREVRKMLWRVGVDEQVYITNVVKCHPKDDRDPTDREIFDCARQWLEHEIKTCAPDLIITAGRFSTRVLLGRSDFTMEMVSGIPYEIPSAPCIILPMTHPAAGFRRQQDLTSVMNAFKLIPGVLNGTVTPRKLPTAPRIDDLDYKVADAQELMEYLSQGGDVLAMDTESGHNNTTWCTTVSNKAGTARMVMGEDKEACGVLEMYITNTDPICVIHSALYDIPELRKINIHPRRIFDTMVAAYMLQDEPLGLKPLAWRHNNVKMDAYLDVIAPARKENALEYLKQAQQIPWPDPEPVLVYEKGMPRIKKPQNIGKKVKRIIDDIAKGKEDKDGQPICPRQRWHNIKEEDGRGMVEEVFGQMPDGFLQDVGIDRAVRYACSDADQTFQLYPHFAKRIVEENLGEPFRDEMGCIWFIDDMHEFGIPCDRDHYVALSDKYEKEMQDIEQEIIEKSGGHIIQLSSHQQVSKLLYDKDKLNLSQYLPKKLGKKAGKTKTADTILAQLKPHHPVVQLIRDHREIAKLRDSYTKKLPKMIGPDGRSHPNFRTTNTNTGRLSEEIWMTLPKKSDKAPEIRNGVKALPVCVILSMDYSQIELRVLAEEANEESMIKAFKAGLDLHALTAHEMFFGPLPLNLMTPEEIKKELEKVDKHRHRLPAKNINFGIIYGLTAEGLHRNMVIVPGCENWTVQLAQEYIDQYFKIRPGIKGYIDETESMAKRHGKVWDWAGRIRRIPGAALVDEYKRAEALRQACNARIQTGAQSIIKRAMPLVRELYLGFSGQGYVCSPMIQIHDSIEAMVQEELLPVLVPAQRAIMEQVRPLKAGVRVDAEISRTGWGELEKYEI